MSVTEIPTDPEVADDEKSGGLRKKLLVLALLVPLVLGGVYWFMLRPAPAGAEKPVPGEVVSLDPIQLNLAEGHYLRVGIALQGVEGAHEIDGAKALDATISEFSGKPLSELQQPQQREKYRKHLKKELDHLYHGEVIDVYFTEFVTQ